MKIAIPLFEKRISPYFDYAPAVLIARIENGAVVERLEAPLVGHDARQRIEYVKNCDIDLLICGGITNQAHAQIETAGIKIIPWVSGEAEKALELYLKGRLVAGAILCGRRRSRWCFCRGREKPKP